MISGSISRVLIVGLGSIGERHISILKRLFPTISIAVLRHKKNNAQPGISGVNCFLSSIESALEFQPQVAIITNPASYHVSIATPLVKAGIHLLIEKPVSNNNEGLDDLIKISKEKNVILMIGYNLRFLPSLQAFRRYLTDKKVGKALSVRVEAGQYLPNWRINKNYRETVSAQRSLGGGVLLELSHEIDYLLWLFGPVDWVKSYVSTQSDLDIDVEDTANIILGFTKDVADYQLTASLNLDFIRHDTTRNCLVIGDKGSLKWDGVIGTVDVFEKGENCWKTIFSDRPEPNQTYEKELKHFFDCVEKNKSPLITIEDGQESVKVIEAIRLSSENKKQVKLRIA